jgi:N-acetylmuramoyl-L-alanine amidase
MALVVIDPGHGGNAPVGDPPSSPNNATGPLGTKEKTLVLDIGLKCRDILRRQGISALVTRDSDVNVGLYERAHVARDHRADAFVSIHLNGHADNTVQGTETWVYHGTSTVTDSYRLATLVLNEAVRATGLRNRGVKIAAAGDLGMLNPREHYLGTAACLVELSFLTDPGEEIRLLTENYRRSLAEAVSVAIYDYVNRRFALLESAGLLRSPAIIPLLDASTSDNSDANLPGVVDDLKAQISAGIIRFDPPSSTADRLKRELLGENEGPTKVTAKLQKLVLELSRTIDAGKHLRISSIIRNQGHHAAGRAVDFGNEDIADHLLRVKGISTDAKVQSLEIDEIIFDAGGNTLQLRNRWNYDVGKRHEFDATTLATHGDHIHFAVKT